MPDGTRNGRQPRRDARNTPTVLKTWPRDGFIAAVWESAELSPGERLIALCYADHARDGDVAWVYWPRLAQRTGFRTKATLSTHTKGLVAAGWFELVSKATQHRSPRYRLKVPEHAARYVYDADEEARELADLDEYRDRKAAAE